MARGRLERVDARIVGAVLNKFDPSKARGYPYYQDRYAYRSAEPGPAGNGKAGPPAGNGRRAKAPSPPSAG